VRNRKQQKVLFFGFFWFLAASLPFFRLMHYFPYSGATMAESWMYLSSLGFFLILGHVLIFGKKAGRIIFVILFALFAVLTITNNADWKDGRTLYRHILKFSPQTGRIRLSLASDLYEARQVKEGQKQIDMLFSGKQLVVDQAFCLSMGDLCALENKNEEAAAFYKKALLFNPQSSLAHNSLGRIYALMGKDGEALDSFSKAVECNPDFWLTYLNLGDLHSRRGFHREAVLFYRKAAELNPDSCEACFKLAFSYANLASYDLALASVQRVLKCDRNSIDALLLEGVLYGKMGRWQEAGAAWRKVLKKDPENVQAQQNIQKAEQISGSLKPKKP